MSEFKFSCPHCDQHLQCDERVQRRSLITSEVECTVKGNGHRSRDADECLHHRRIDLAAGRKGAEHDAIRAE